MVRDKITTQIFSWSQVKFDDSCTVVVIDRVVFIIRNVDILIEWRLSFTIYFLSISFPTFCWSGVCSQGHLGNKLIAAPLFVWNWLRWQKVSDGKIQITILILRRGTLSMQIRWQPERASFRSNKKTRMILRALAIIRCTFGQGNQTPNFGGTRTWALQFGLSDK